jgi:DNA polymerase-3 subunit delta'
MTNTSLVGNEELRHKLLNAFNSQSLPHAFIITGPEGIGKSRIAFELAQRILKITTPITADSNNIHGDLLILKQEESKDITVDQVRQLKSFFAMTPANSGYRVVIIDAADNLNNNAANALLKSLEEPPANCFLVLINHIPGKVLATIKSRCSIYHAQPLSTNEASGVLHKLLTDPDKQDLAHLLKLSHNAPGIALKLSEGSANIMYDKILSIINTIPNISFAQINNLIDNDIGKDENNWYTFKWLISFIINQAAKSYSNHNLHSEFKLLIDKTKLERWLFLWDKLNNMIRSCEQVNIERKQIVTLTFTTLAKTLD